MVTAGMTPRDAVRQLEARLTAAGCPDADYDAAELFRLVTGRDVRLADAPLPEAQAARLESLCLRREAREPLQYLCGRWSFLDFELIVGPGVLCPRADTEVVAEAAAQTLAGVKAPRVLDLCAGTGCLGLGVKRFRTHRPPAWKKARKPSAIWNRMCALPCPAQPRRCRPCRGTCSPTGKACRKGSWT